MLGYIAGPFFVDMSANASDDEPEPEPEPEGEPLPAAEQSVPSGSFLDDLVDAVLASHQRSRQR